MHLRLLAAAAIVTAALACFAPADARADGIFVWASGTDLQEPNQRAILGWDGKTETLILAVKYEGPAEDFAWVVPLPAKPEVAAIAADKNPFGEISHFTQERAWTETGVESVRPAAVEVLERKVAGVYDIAVLAAKDPTALADWLKKNGYAFPEAHKDILAHYTRKEWVYAAMRIDPKQLGGDEARKLKTGELQLVRFTFASKEMVYPLKISSGNAGVSEVLLYLVAEAPMVLASGPAAPGLEPDAIVIPSARAGYPMDMRYGTPEAVKGERLPLTWEALGLAKDAARHVCKYRAAYKSDEMKDDLVFKPFDAVPYFKALLEKPHQGKPGLDTGALLLIQQAPDDQDLLMRLAKDENPDVKIVVANTPKAGVSVLEKLAEDAQDYIRREVAQRKDLAPALLGRLAQDKVDFVRMAVIDNPATPEDILKALTQDPEENVRFRADFILRNRTAAKP